MCSKPPFVHCTTIVKCKIEWGYSIWLPESLKRAFPIHFLINRDSSHSLEEVNCRYSPSILNSQQNWLLKHYGRSFYIYSWVPFKIRKIYTVIKALQNGNPSTVKKSERIKNKKYHCGKINQKIVFTICKKPHRKPWVKDRGNCHAIVACISERHCIYQSLGKINILVCNKSNNFNIILKCCWVNTEPRQWYSSLFR